MKDLKGRWIVALAQSKPCCAPKKIGMYQGNVLDILAYLSKKHPNETFLITESLLDGELITHQDFTKNLSVTFRVDFAESALGDLTIEDLTDACAKRNLTVEKGYADNYNNLLRVVHKSCA